MIDPLAVRDLGPLWDARQRPFDRSRHARRRRRPADLPFEDRHPAAARLRRADRRRADGPLYPLSLVNLVSQVLSVSLAGSETRTDWRHRPLSPAQLDYALDDVRHLLDLADHLRCSTGCSLDAADWAEAEFEDLIRSVARRADEDRWRRLPGLHHLGRRCLEMARRLADWREDEARRMNRPLRQILRDDLLVAIAKRQPTNRRGLEALRDFNRPALLKRSQEILDILEAARAVPEEQLPELAPRDEEPTRSFDNHQPALRRPRAVLCAKPNRRFDRGQCRRSQRADPLVRRWPRSVSQARAPATAGEAASAASFCWT